MNIAYVFVQVSFVAGLVIASRIRAWVFYGIMRSPDMVFDVALIGRSKITVRTGMGFLVQMYAINVRFEPLTGMIFLGAKRTHISALNFLVHAFKN